MAEGTAPSDEGASGGAAPVSPQGKDESSDNEVPGALPAKEESSDDEVPVSPQGKDESPDDAMPSAPLTKEEPASDPTSKTIDESPVIEKPKAKGGMPLRAAATDISYVERSWNGSSVDSKTKPADASATAVPSDGNASDSAAPDDAAATAQGPGVVALLLGAVVAAAAVGVVLWKRVKSR